MILSFFFPDTDLDQKGEAREAEIPFLPGIIASWVTFPAFLSSSCPLESESPYPSGLSSSLSGSLNLGGETEVRGRALLCES